jgi:hypothetical protein
MPVRPVSALDFKKTDVISVGLDQKNTVTTQFELTVSIKQVRNKDEGPSATQANMWE